MCVTLPRLATAQANYRVDRAAGTGPAPVVLLVSGCSGFITVKGVNLYDERAREFVAGGYNVIFVDYLGQRGMQKCGGGNPSHADIGKDIRATVAWAAQQPWADPKRIYAIGWSYGGGALITALAEAPAGSVPLARAVMYYPACQNVRAGWTVNVPALVLFGAIDDVAPPSACDTAMNATPAAHRRAITYPNARHAFDVHSLPERMGVQYGSLHGSVGYNEAAAKSSWEEVLAFLR